jgi:small conductance mechanosensitive channel
MGRLHGRRAPDLTLQTFVSSMVRYVILAIGFVAMLQQLGVKTTSIVAVLGAASLAVGLALQGALSNVAAGVMILLFRPYRVGDIIETGGKKGTVKALDLVITELATADNLKIVIPNNKVFGDVIVNHSHHGQRRVDVTFRVPAAADTGPSWPGCWRGRRPIRLSWRTRRPASPWRCWPRTPSSWR